MDVQFDKTKSSSARRALMLLVPFVFSVIGLTAPQVTRAANAPTSCYVPLTPARILDTRAAIGVSTTDPIAGGSSIDLQVTGVAGVPSDGVTAVVLNVAAVDAAGPGYLTVWPAGQTMPIASNVNPTQTDRTVANLAVVPVGVGGRVSLYTQQTSHMVVDVEGYFASASTATAGRFIPLTPSRLVDTRSGLGAPQAPVNQASISVQATGVAGVPATGVSAVAINVVSVNPDLPGFLTVWPGGEPMPVASTVNSTATGDVKANLAWVKVGPTGLINIYSNTSSDVVVDVVGYFTDTTATNSTDGLFVPLAPQRVMDTRNKTPFARPNAGDTHNLSFAGSAGVPSTGVSAILFTFTAVATDGPGFFTVFPALQNRPNTSSVNTTMRGDVKANLVVAQVSTLSAAIASYQQVGGDNVADVAGYFTGTPYAMGQQLPVDVPPTSPDITITCRVSRLAAPITFRIFTITFRGLTPDPTPTDQDWSGGYRAVFATDSDTHVEAHVYAHPDAQGVATASYMAPDNQFGVYPHSYPVQADGTVHWAGSVAIDAYDPPNQYAPGYVPAHTVLNIDISCSG